MGEGTVQASVQAALVQCLLLHSVRSLCPCFAAGAAAAAAAAEVAGWGGPLAALGEEAEAAILRRALIRGAIKSLGPVGYQGNHCWALIHGRLWLVWVQGRLAAV